MKSCTKCGEEKDLNLFPLRHYKGRIRGRQSWCRSCTSRAIRDCYAKNKPAIISKVLRYRKTEAGKKAYLKGIKQWQSRNPLKIKAQAKVRYRIKKGLWEKGACIKCKNPNAHAHHEDYSKPLEIVWLCHIHHMERHREIRDSNPE